MKKINDERIKQEENRVNSKMYGLMMILMLIGVVIKLCMGMSWKAYILETICFVVTIPFVMINMLRKGILFVKATDACLKGIKESILANALMICFWVIITGELLLMLMDESNINICCLYLPVWIIPALIVTIYSIKKGLLIWGGNRRKIEGRTAFKKRVAIGALFYGIIMRLPYLYEKSTFHPEEILWIMGMAFLWGIPFYLVMNLLIDISEKRADKEVQNNSKE